MATISCSLTLHPLSRTGASRCDRYTSLPRLERSENTKCYRRINLLFDETAQIDVLRPWGASRQQLKFWMKNSRPTVAADARNGRKLKFLLDFVQNGKPTSGARDWSDDFVKSDKCDGRRKVKGKESQMWRRDSDRATIIKSSKISDHKDVTAACVCSRAPLCKENRLPNAIISIIFACCCHRHPLPSHTAHQIAWDNFPTNPLKVTTLLISCCNRYKKPLNGQRRERLWFLFSFFFSFQTPAKVFGICVRSRLRLDYAHGEATLGSVCDRRRHVNVQPIRTQNREKKQINGRNRSRLRCRSRRRNTAC